MTDLGIVLDQATGLKLQHLRLNEGFSAGNTRLVDFLTTTSATNIGANIVDPLLTFDVEFQFFPAFHNYLSKKSIYGSDSNTQDTFLYKLTDLILNKSLRTPLHETHYTQLVILIGYYVLSMTLPQMVMPEAGKVPTLFGEFPVNNLYIKPDNNTFTMSLLNTKISLHDFIFYPWMREVTMPKWSYETLPYTTANVTVKFDKHANSRYVFVGCRPTQIASRQPTQAPEGEPTRDVTMLFDYMFITAADQGKPYAAYKLLDILKELDKLFNNEKAFRDLITKVS